jgi:hypothetical protein
MTRAATLVHDTEAAKSTASRQPSSVRVSHPGDSFEVEADRVADTVSRGGRVAGWSLSASGFDCVSRQPETPPPAASPGEIAGKVAEALLATPAGKKALDTVTSAVTSPAGLVVTGATAIGVVTALDRAKKPLPAQAPAIPLDFLHPGLSVKISYNGPVNKPTDGSITFSYAPKSGEKKPAQTATEKLRSENAAMAADQEKFRAGLQPQGGVGPVKTPELGMFEKWRLLKLAAVGKFSRPAEPSAAGAPAPPAAAEPAKAPAPAEKKPEHAPTPKVEEKKKEEPPVQRKAEPSGSVTTGSADLDSVLRSPGRPLDRATRREMESRIGYDFSTVRLHTDSPAAESAKSLSAQAYTVGSNVVFAPGRFAPQTTEGRRLLAHELTHVVQQTTSPQRAHPAVRPAPAHVQRFSAMDIPGAGWLVDKIRGLRGYKLVCTLVGHDLFDDSVAYERNASTIAQGILELIPYGQELYDKLAKAGRAIEKAYSWLEGEFRKRNLTVDGILDVLDRAVHAFSGWHPIASGEDVIAILMEPIDQLIDLAGVIGKKVLEFILEGVVSTFGETGQKVWAFFKRAGNVIARIATHPLEFGKNLLKAVGEGFKNFFANIWDHLSEGVKTWIYDELDLPKDIKMPADFTFGSMFKLLLQVLGLTWEHRRAQLVEKLEPIGGETVVYFFEKSVEIFQRIRKEGIGAIKDLIMEQADKIFDSFVESIKSWIAKEFIEQGLKLIAELSNPAGELIKVVESIIDTVMFIIEKAQKLKELIDTVVNALSEIVDGNTGPAAKRVEDTLAKSIPLLLGFIADQIGLRGIGKSIREIIHKIRDPIDKVIGKVLDVIVDKVKPLWEAGKAAFTAKLDAIKEWWTKPLKFNYGEEEHELSVEGDGDKSEVFVNSAKTRLRDFLKDHNAGPKQTQRANELAKQLKWKTGKDDTPGKREAGYNAFVELQKLMDHLKSKYPEKSQVKDQNPVVTPLGSADYAEAFLTPQLITGSPPSESSDPPAWNDLGQLLPPSPPSYVRAHLISQELGGRGEWTNMMPATNAANGLLAKNVEEVLKAETAKKNNTFYYHYKMTAKYKNRTVPLPPETSPVARSKAAARRLVSLSWTVRDAIFDPLDSKFKLSSKEAKSSDGTVLPKEIRQGSVDANRGFDPT